MDKVLDLRGLSCPQPVILTLEEIKKAKEGKICILVDTDTSKENILRATISQGWEVDSVIREGTGYRIVISKKR
ncbi:MAG: sulfurtransferase TusA family protein [Desulfobacterota bacterium]|nr:sulfurtransferase TusA family protein [Thermodesulfobacteriota bacterium]MDW8002482.1 sulfurtransferase TusA family protein [Deltaproteobacteria bacterium]